MWWINFIAWFNMPAPVNFQCLLVVLQVFLAALVPVLQGSTCSPEPRSSTCFSHQLFENWHNLIKPPGTKSHRLTHRNWKCLKKGYSIAWFPHQNPAEMALWNANMKRQTAKNPQTSALSAVPIMVLSTPFKAPEIYPNSLSSHSTRSDFHNFKRRRFAISSGQVPPFQDQPERAEGNSQRSWLGWFVDQIARDHMVDQNRHRRNRLIVCWGFICFCLST